VVHFKEIGFEKRGCISSLCGDYKE